MSDKQVSTQVNQEFNHNLQRMRPEFAKALPAHIKPEKFERIVMTAVALNPALLGADRRSLFAACTRAAQDGLLPDGREAALVAYGSTINYLPMVSGIMKKVRNSGEIGAWSVHVVKEKDTFDYELGDEERITHKPAHGERGKTIGAYSIVKLKDGEKSREYMTIEDIEAIRTRSKAKDSGPWKTDYDEMCKKTVIRRHSKRLPMSTDLDDVIRRDDDMMEFEPAPEVVQQGPSPTRPTRLGAVVGSDEMFEDETLPPQEE